MSVFTMFSDQKELDKIKVQFENISDLEASIIYLKKQHLKYAQIQSLLGNPSKKYIRQTLLKYSPELLNEN